MLFDRPHGHDDDRTARPAWSNSWRSISCQSTLPSAPGDWSTRSDSVNGYDGGTGFSTGPSGVSSIEKLTESDPDAQQSGSSGA